MKKGVVGFLIVTLPYVVFSQGVISFNNLFDSPDLGQGGLVEGDLVDPFTTFTPGSIVFFPGTGGSGSSYATGSGSGLMTPPGTASDVRSRSFSGSDYFTSSGQVGDTSFQLQLGNGVNPLIDSSGKIEVVPEPKPLVIQGGKVKADGSFELSVKGPPQVAFYVEVSTDGKTFSGLTQKELSGSLDSYTCNEKGQCTAIDREAGQSPFRFYRLQVLDTPTAAAVGN